MVRNRWLRQWDRAVFEIAATQKSKQGGGTAGCESDANDVDAQRYGVDAQQASRRRQLDMARQPQNAPAYSSRSTILMTADKPLTPEHMTEAGWSYEQMSFIGHRKLPNGMLLRSPAETWLLVQSLVGQIRCDLQHVETVSDFNRLCETFGI